MNNKITTLSRERLEEIAELDEKSGLYPAIYQCKEMSRALLAVMDAQQKPRGWLTFHSIPPTWSDPGGGGEYLDFHEIKPAINSDDGTEAWPVFDAPSALPPDGWIKCSDRMPDKYKAVLVFDENRVSIMAWNGGKYWQEVNTNDDFFIPTHWMPLPEVPGGE